MATQEIGLNEALAARASPRYETDLAELIVQLGHDLPSHILVPAIHRNRSEIREIFLREMARGRPAPEPDRRPRRAGRGRAAAPAGEVPARQGRVSGANFAIAETGTLVVVESEGNGRMCLTLPRR
jgi:L-lactate dehydrogenase complex protein LldF